MGGLLYQVYQLSELYFGYPISSRLIMSLPQTLTPFALSICIRYMDLLDFDKVNKMPGRHDWNYMRCVLPGLDDYLRHIQDNMTIGEIFEYTPNTSEILSRVTFRQEGSYELYQLSDSSEIYEVFNVSKTVYLEYVCYKIMKINDTDQKFPYSFISISPVRGGLIYDFEMGPRLKRSMVLKLVVHPADRDPYRSLQLSKQVRRYYDEVHNRADYSTFSVYQNIFEVFALPPPYETKCFDYSTIGYTSNVECKETCIKHAVEKEHTLKKMPFTYIYHGDKNESEKMLISYYDILSDTLAKKIFDIEAQCTSNEGAPCKRKTCHEIVAASKVDQRGGEKLTVRQVLPVEPWITSNIFSVMVFMDYLVYATSILGTYTGFNMVWFYPKHLMSIFHSFQDKNEIKYSRCSAKVKPTEEHRSWQSIPFLEAKKKIANLEVKINRILANILLILNNK
jgi:hypothetical protein